LLYLRARHYSPADGRFTSRDTWMGDYNRPLSLNRWNYTQSNPINYTDPSGFYICTNPLPASCQTGLASMRATASVIKEFVKSGAWLPVDGFAAFTSFSQSQYFSNIRDLIWAMTIVLNDFDTNRGPVWKQATGSMGGAENGNFIGQDWLAYSNNIEFNKEWCYPPDSNDCYHSEWVHSLRGDWKTTYWDKTANQAYHFWFYAAVTFFDGAGYAIAGNEFHDHVPVTKYDFINSPEWEAPPHPRQSTVPDRALGYAAIRLGSRLRFASFIQEQKCSDVLSASLMNFDVGMWIKSNLRN